MSARSLDPALSRTALWWRLATVAISATNGATAHLLSAPVWLTALVAVISSATTALIGLVANPRRLGAWLEDVEELLPKITQTLDTWRNERRKWRRPRPDRPPGPRRRRR